MGHGGGGRINKPKSSLCKKNLRKEKKMKVKALKRLSAKGRSNETLGDTTVNILRQCRSNPKANVHLSGKKKRLLLKEAKRVMQEKAIMEISDKKEDSAPSSSQMETS